MGNVIDINKKHIDSTKNMVRGLADILENELGDMDLSNFSDKSRRELFLVVSVEMAKAVGKWLVEEWRYLFVYLAMDRDWETILALIYH